MEETSPIINNIKARIQLKNDDLKELQETLSVWKKVKKYRNFLVIKERFTYTIWPASGTVNIIGLKNLDDVAKAVSEMCREFKIDVTRIRSELVIDNVCASGHFGKTINLLHLEIQLYKNKRFNVDLNRMYRPGAVCRTYARIGTIIVFSSGAYIIVGAKCLENVKTLFQKMIAVIKTL
jgi:TATA-box binding protein (TBP) (component of TFIID and TFIIIB)